MKAKKAAAPKTSTETATKTATSTKTSTVANPHGNVTVTGGAGDGCDSVRRDDYARDTVTNSHGR